MSAAEVEFQPWPKIARLNRDIVVTEKIDGTNAAVIIADGTVSAQSRQRRVPQLGATGGRAWSRARGGGPMILHDDRRQPKRLPREKTKGGSL